MSKAVDRCLALRKDADVDRLKLLPCPFCGGHAVITGPNRGNARCENDECGASKYAFLVEDWNRRSAFSQEAVRDEVLAKRLVAYYAEWAPRMRGDKYEAGDWKWLAMHLRDIAEASMEVELSPELQERKEAAIRALKREPNAAGRAEVESEKSDVSAKPAPAAPDVRWIPVSERLPEGLALWLNENGTMYVGEWDGPPHENTTHWMPLPPAPGASDV